MGQYYNRPNFYNQKNWKSFSDWKKQKDADNPWDAESIKPPYSRPVYVRNTNKCLQGIQNPINRLSKNNELLLKTTIESSPVWHKDHILKELAKHPSPLLGQAVYHNLLYRAKQLAYLQPIFELFLDPPCKGLVYISTIGTKFWVIGTTDAHAKANFNSNQKTFRVAFEGYLQFKNSKFVLPKFVVVHYRFSFPAIKKLPVLKTPLSPISLEAMSELKTILSNRKNLDKNLDKNNIEHTDSQSPHSIIKTFYFKNYPKASITHQTLQTTKVKEDITLAKKDAFITNNGSAFIKEISLILKNKNKNNENTNLVPDNSDIPKLELPQKHFSFKDYSHLFLDYAQDDFNVITDEQPIILTKKQQETIALIDAMIIKK